LLIKGHYPLWPASTPRLTGRQGASCHLGRLRGVPSSERSLSERLWACYDQTVGASLPQVSTTLGVLSLCCGKNQGRTGLHASSPHQRADIETLCVHGLKPSNEAERCSSRKRGSQLTDEDIFLSLTALLSCNLQTLCTRTVQRFQYSPSLMKFTSS
jgi:hypothetical protein